MNRADENGEWFCFVPGTNRQYVISTNARVYSVRLRRFMRQFRNPLHGYHHLALSMADGTLWPTRVHKVVMRSFCGYDGDVDHINGNRGDDRLANLRPCTQGQNNMNAPIRRDNTSGYRGVAFHRPSGLWLARIHFQGKQISLKYHKTAEAAAMAWNIAARTLYGSFARLNEIQP